MHTDHITHDHNPSTNVDTLADTLISHLNLSDADVMAIREAMINQNMGFANAALSLNLVTQRQLQELTEHKASTADNGTISIIEAARRKMFGGQLRHHKPALSEPDEMCSPTSQLTVAHDAFCEHSEKMRGLRTELTLRFGRSSQGVMLAVTSPGSGEGRSTLAAELAITFAQLERRTLLVDTDLRHPSLHHLFNCSNERGLSQTIIDEVPPYLFGMASLPQLRVLTSGAVPANPLETLSTKRFEQLVNSWRVEYDFVIFDTPPVSQFADALTIATLVKRVLITSRAHQTNLNATKDMLRRLAYTQSEVLGAVLNHY